MIRTLRIQGYKSFSAASPVIVEFEDKPALLLYGMNGAGKSAIGQIIDRNGNQREPVPGCTLEVSPGGPFSFLVYNEEFVQRTFGNSAGMPGIFTLGEQNTADLREKEAAESELSELSGRHTELSDRKATREQELDRLSDQMHELAWKSYRAHDDGPFDRFLVGFGKSKPKFFQQLQRVTLDDDDLVEELDALKQRLSDIENDESGVKSKVSANGLEVFARVEADSIWSKTISGSTDSRLSGLVTERKNIHWVKQGRSFLKDATCPFCQVRVADDFEAELVRLLDTSYEQDVAVVEERERQYRVAQDALGEEWTRIRLEPFANESPLLNAAYDRLTAVLQANRLLMRTKLEAPRDPIRLTSTDAEVEALRLAIQQVNQRIAEFNGRISDRVAVEEEVRAGFWKRLKSDNKDALTLFEDAKRGIAEAIQELDTEMSTLTERERLLRARVRDLAARSVGTLAAVEAINARLAHMGVSGFEIVKHTDKDNLYRLARPGVGIGEYASLSEGEKTLISFLYFVELVSGSAAPDTSTPLSRKIVVVDDPISSLSHNYVYDIATLIARELVRPGGGGARQVVVLTHSLFFYHELLKHLKDKHVDLRRVVKSSHSQVVPMGRKDILSDYAAYWQILKDARRNLAHVVAVPNAMRCIFEHFFAFTERREEFRLALEQLEGDDHRFTPLARYLNRESHADGINLTDFGEYDLDYFMSKFEAVFNNTGYPDHFGRWMNSD